MYRCRVIGGSLIFSVTFGSSITVESRPSYCHNLAFDSGFLSYKMGVDKLTSCMEPVFESENESEWTF